MFHTVGVQLPGFIESTFTHDGLTRSVYAGGSGPAVIVIHEVPREDVGRFPLRKVPTVEGIVRVVEISGFDWSACGGTHAGRD